MTLELATQAKQHLTGSGKLTAEESHKLRRIDEVTGILSCYFTGKIGLDELRLELRNLKEAFGDSALTEAQLRIIDVLALHKSNVDFEHCRLGILAGETLKGQNHYDELDSTLNRIGTLCQRYRNGVGDIEKLSGPGASDGSNRGDPLSNSDRVFEEAFRGLIEKSKELAT